VVPMWFPVKFPVVCSGVPGGFECSSPWFLPVEALVVSSGFPCGFQWSSPSRFLQPAGSAAGGCIGADAGAGRAEKPIEVHR
jgi:hypothetical protein